MYVNRNPEYFLTIAREGNISHAAEKLFLTQSSLSQHLQRLEREVGMPLVDRSTIPLRLTPAGKVYREYLEKPLSPLAEKLLHTDHFAWNVTDCF